MKKVVNRNLSMAQMFKVPMKQKTIAANPKGSPKQRRMAPSLLSISLLAPEIFTFLD